MQNEVWCDIKGWSNFYKISNFGNVKSIERTIIRSNGKKYHCKERLLKAVPNSNGYLMVFLNKEGYRKGYKVHKLVYNYFGSLSHLSNMMIDHKDTNKTNNNIENLRLVTRSQNKMNSNINKNKKVKYKGVSIFRDKYLVQITKNGTKFFLGYYNSPKEAARVYDQKAVVLFGEYARTNKDLYIYEQEKK